VASGFPLGRSATLLAALSLPAFAAGQLAERCTPCHGPGGNSTTPGIPSIAAQPQVFLENLLILMREGLRGGPAMQQLLAGAGDREIVAVAAHYAKLPGGAEGGGSEQARV
jgi:cytochrome c553